MKTTIRVLFLAFLPAAILGAPPVAGQGKPPNPGPLNTLLNLVEPKTIFVTSEAYTGDLVQEAFDHLEITFTDEEGLEAADALCQYHADQTDSIVPEGTYIALLSTEEVHASARMTLTEGPIIRPDGAIVANSATELFTALPSSTEYLTNEPDKTELTGAPPGADMVWTTTISKGTSFGNHCDNWTVSDSQQGSILVGTPSERDHAWVDNDLENCGQQNALYCIQR